jgi:hypothetical protein
VVKPGSRERSSQAEIVLLTFSVRFLTRRMLRLFIVTRRIPHQPRLAERLEPAIPPLPDQQTFRQYLRELVRGAIRAVVKDVMREELDALIGVEWGESNRQQQRRSQRLLQP